ncbi:MAG: adenylate kinase [Rikenellaceae bacterium]
MLNIVLFGAPGCGKGTQAARLKEKYGVNHVSTGDVIRGEISRGTELGKEMAAYTTTGRLAPDAIVIGMIENYIAEHKEDKGNIFDGFPRTTAQAEAFDVMLKENNDSVDVMIYMEVPEEELVTRILLRGKDSGRADDASEDVIRNRISVYNEQTAVVASYYEKQGKYAAVNGLGSMDEVFDRICAAIDSAIA